MNCLCNETLSRKERKAIKTNKGAHMPLNCLRSRMPGHSASCHHQGAEGAAGAEGWYAAPGPGEEVLCRITQQHLGGPQLSGRGESSWWYRRLELRLALSWLSSKILMLMNSSWSLKIKVNGLLSGLIFPVTNFPSVKDGLGTRAKRVAFCHHISFWIGFLRVWVWTYCRLLRWIVHLLEPWLVGMEMRKFFYAYKWENSLTCFLGWFSLLFPLQLPPTVVRWLRLFLDEQTAQA